MIKKLFVIAVALSLLFSVVLATVGGEAVGEDDVSLQEEINSDYPFKDEYPSVEQLHGWYDELVEENPDITEKIHLGESWEGRDIWAIKISDDVEEEQDEPSIFINGNLHSREWSSNQVSAYYVWRLVNDYGSNETITWLVNNRQIYVAPMVNPDGYIYDGNGDLSQAEGWRKNRNDSTPTDSVGVDLNRNWDIDWENADDDPTSYTYRGETPFSEYETQHLKDFILSKDIDSYQDIHSHFGTLLIPWSYTSDPSPHDDLYRELAGDMTSMTSYLGDDDEQYSYGQAGEEIGYSASGGSIDWVYEETGAISLCYELYTPDSGMAGFYPDEEYIMDINLDVYDSLVYQARIADLDMGDGDDHLYPPSPYIVYGNFNDDEGDPLINTDLTLENLATGETLSTRTDQNGYYEFNFGNFVDNGYEIDDHFSIRAEDHSHNFTIDESWGQRLDIDGPATHQLTLDAEGEGTVEIDGEKIAELPYEQGYMDGDEIRLKAVPEEGWEFYGWTGDHESDEEEITVIMDENKDITANFEPEEHTLTVDTVGEGEVEIEPDRTEYEHGEKVNLTAVPSEGHEFLGWEGTDETEEEITITMDDDKEITANFEIETYELTLNVEGEGSVDVEPDKAEYEHGEEVILTADSDEGWEFVGWRDTDETEDDITVTMNDDKEITAVFEEEAYEVPGFTSLLLLTATIIAVAIYRKKDKE